MNRRARLTRLGGLVGLLVLAALSAIPTETSAHRPRPAASAGDSVAKPYGEAAKGQEATEHGDVAGARGAPERPYEMPAMSEAMVHHLHNKLVHFPIVLAPLALILFWVERRRPGAQGMALWVLWAAALAGIAAFLTGRGQMGAFDHDPKAWVVEIHERWGIATTIALTAWALLATWRRGGRLLLVIGAVGCLLALVAAFYGGVVAHG